MSLRLVNLQAVCFHKCPFYLQVRRPFCSSHIHSRLLPFKTFNKSHPGSTGGGLFWCKVFGHCICCCSVNCFETLNWHLVTHWQLLWMRVKRKASKWIKANQTIKVCKLSIFLCIFLCWMLPWGTSKATLCVKSHFIHIAPVHNNS